jgi:heme exporter protein D
MIPSGWELFGADAYYIWGSVVATLVSMAVEWAAVAARERDVERRGGKSGVAPA